MFDELLDAIKKSNEGSVENDRALLQLCEGIIEQVHILVTLSELQRKRSEQLENRLEALTSAFYSHCQDVIIDDDERTH